MDESEHASAGITKEKWRGDQPQAENDRGHLLPALQRDILKLGNAKYQDANRHRVNDHGAGGPPGILITVLRRKPGRQRNQDAKRHAKPVFPRAMRTEKARV